MHNPNQAKIITTRQIQGEFGASGSYTIPNTNTTNATGSNNSYYCDYVALVQTTLSGTQTVDGASPSNGNRILVPSQTDATENGIYNYNTSGAWTRIEGLGAGNQITILGGTKKGSIWVVETQSFVIGTDNISIIETAISRKDSSFTGFNAVSSLLTSDIGLFQVSSNEIQSATVGDIIGLVATGSELDNAYRTLYVSENFTTGGAFYDTLAGAITYANTLAFNVNIIVYAGTYTGNYSLDPNVVLFFMPETFLIATDKTIAVLILSAGARVFGKVRIEYAITSGYSVTMAKNCIFEADTCSADTDAIVINDPSGSAIDSQIRVKELGHVAVTALAGNLYIESDKFSQLTFAGSNECYVNCKLFKKNVTTSTGTVYLNTDRYFKIDDTIFNINGGTTIANGRVDNYSDATNSTTGDGHIAKLTAGTLKLHDFYAKNGAGGVIFGGGAATLIIANSVLQATVGGGGGSSDTICGSVGFTVRFSGNTGINTATAGGITEQVTTNKILDAAITI